jgi:mRNA-degrading endonuclease toxin of MazEF toxin-antitoxin module
VTSWIKLSNLANVPRSAVARRPGRLLAISLQEVDERLKLALDLD